jgi:uroporphyrin-III C-methyltransferase/precorrin-2 dehydrogenase/sirohydrochlorin ferrochelatase
MRELLPIFVTLAGRRVLLVGGGAVAAAKLRQLQAVGADVAVIAPSVHEEIVRSGVSVCQRAFEPADLDGAWFVVAAATPEVNQAVAAAAAAKQLFVNAVDDPPNASAYLSGVVRRADVTVAISTSGDAPALAGLLREALEAVLPEDLDKWMAVAREERAKWRRDGVPMNERRPLLLEALNRIYELAAEHAEFAETRKEEDTAAAASASAAADVRKDS